MNEAQLNTVLGSTVKLMPNASRSLRREWTLVDTMPSPDFPALQLLAQQLIAHGKRGNVHLVKVGVFFEDGDVIQHQQSTHRPAADYARHNTQHRNLVDERHERDKATDRQQDAEQPALATAVG